MPAIQHAWNLSPTEAVNLQRELRPQVDLSPMDRFPEYIGGADISFNKGEDTFYAGIVVLDAATLEVVDTSCVAVKGTFPYVPGLLSFREIPSLLTAWHKLPVKPDVVMVDGHGYAHPRRMGIATHFGLVTGVPTLGCAKKILTGKLTAELTAGRFSTAPLMAGDELLGFALRTKERVQPVYISAGHGMSHTEALAIARHCSGKYKLPEATRQAHEAVNAFRRGG